MMRFEHPEMLYLLVLLPVLVAAHFYWVLRRRKRLRKFGDPLLVQKLMPHASLTRAHTRLAIFLAAMMFGIFAAAGPQSGSKLHKVTRKGVDLIIALDVSNSMLAEDISPNRISRAKQAISRLIDRLDGDRIGLIVFAGKAFVQLPLTSDYGAARLFLSQVSTSLIDVQGTALGEAVSKSAEAFESNKSRSKAIIVISDGENHEDDAEAAVRKALEEGITVHALGIGSPNGVPIPEYSDGRVTGYKKDMQGSTVMTRLDETELRKMAAAGNGKYILANDSKFGLDELFKEIGQMEESVEESREFADYINHYQWLLLPAILLLMIEILLPERRRHSFNLLRILQGGRK